MTNLSDCDPIWQNPKNKLTVSVATFNDVAPIVNIVLIIAALSTISILFMFLYQWRGPEILIKLANNGYRGAYGFSGMFGLIWALNPVIFHFGPELLDSSTDVYYFYSLSKMKTVVHPWSHAIQLMVFILALSIIKDVICTYLFIDLFIWYTKNNENQIDDFEICRQKIKKIAISTLMEDLGQVIIQFYFFEKYMVTPNNFIYFNTILMFLSSCMSLKAILTVTHEM